MNCKMKSIIAAFTGAVVGGVLGTCIAGRIEGEVTTKAELMSEKHLALFQLMNKHKTRGKKYIKLSSNK